ncbi:MAG TPA: GNAT family protein [Acidimicrobiales bacterium]|nr:GNAT family protein [Acidimicrobiales bacterium]
MGSFWPLFDLRLETSRLALRPPTDADFPALLAAIDAGIHDPTEMPFSVPWTDAAPDARRRAAAQHWWRNRAMWSADEWHLTMAVFRDDEAIGVQELCAVGYPALREVRTGSWLTRAAQGQGYGKEMRAAVLQLAFEGLDAEVARTAAFVDNTASLRVSRAVGYRENGHHRLVRRGVPTEIVDFEMTRADWFDDVRRRQPPAVVRGLDACVPMFSASPPTS